MPFLSSSRHKQFHRFRNKHIHTRILLSPLICVNITKKYTRSYPLFLCLTLASTYTCMSEGGGTRRLVYISIWPLFAKSPKVWLLLKMVSTPFCVTLCEFLFCSFLFFFSALLKWNFNKI